MNKTSVVLIAGLGYGDEGKGSLVDYLSRREGARVVVRYNGGAQAGHRVVLPDGREHVFSQFGSGALVEGVLTHLSRFMLVEPFGMLNENEHLLGLGCKDAFTRTTIDERAPIVTPFHIAANRLLELSRGDNRHGSCGLGIGETVEDLAELGEDALLARDLADGRTFRRKLSFIRERKLAKVREALGSSPRSEKLEGELALLEDNEVVGLCMDRYGVFAAIAQIVKKEHLSELLGRGPAIFEGAQGMLLDPKYGFPPHVTKTDITYANALALLREAGYGGSVRKIGVVRGYFTRHGAGPFATQDEELTSLLPDACNFEHAWQGKFRVGHFDLAAARRSLEGLGGVDGLAVTCLDRLVGLAGLKLCVRYGAGQEPVYENLIPFRGEGDALRYANTLAERLGYPLSVVSFGPTAEDKLTPPRA